MRITDRVRERIQQCHLSLREVSAKSDVSVATLSRLLRGRGEPTQLTERKLDAWLALDGYDPPKVERKYFSTVVILGGEKFRLTLEGLK